MSYFLKYREDLINGIKIPDFGKPYKVGTRYYNNGNLHDYSDILKKIPEETVNRKFIHDKNEIKKLSKKIFTTNFYQSHKKRIEEYFSFDDIIFGFGGHDQFCIIFTNKEFLVSSGIILKETLVFRIEDLEFLNFKQSKIFLGENNIGNTIHGKHEKYNNIVKELKTFLKGIYDKVSEEIRRKKREEEYKLRLKEEKDILEEVREEEKQREELVEKINKLKTEIISQYDKDCNGKVDVVESDDFSEILKKNQSKIIEIDRSYIQKFVKISTYLKTQKKNIELIFEKMFTEETTITIDIGNCEFNYLQKVKSIRKVKEVTGLGDNKSKNLVENSIKNGSDKVSVSGKDLVYFNYNQISQNITVFEEYVHSYNLLVFSSLNMIVSLVDDDMITFYDIYESLDNLNIFDSKHERDLSEKLNSVTLKLNLLNSEIRTMGNKIVNSIDQLTYVTEESQSNLTKHLDSINSSVNVNNLLTGINTYQLYTLNKNTKSLRS